MERRLRTDFHLLMPWFTWSFNAIATTVTISPWFKLPSQRFAGRYGRLKIKRPFFAILGATTKEKSEQGKLNLIHKSLAAKTSWCENTETTEKLLQLDYCGLWVASLASNPTLTDDPDIPPGCCPKDWLAVHNALERRCPWKNDWDTYICMYWYIMEIFLFKKELGSEPDSSTHPVTPYQIAPPKTQGSHATATSGTASEHYNTSQHWWPDNKPKKTWSQKNQEIRSFQNS